jgi:glyoxylase-like metal-dependent hydrolase (beta-lactamase superfamily II)
MNSSLDRSVEMTAAIGRGSERLLFDCGEGTQRQMQRSLGLVQADEIYLTHFHADHTGQLDPFKNATLLIGKADWDQITSPTPMQGANVAGFKSWTGESRKVEPLTGDKDVFGDGSVVVLRMPGHTPGHSSLLVRLKDMGPVLLTGDLVHFRENYDTGGVPSFNFDRAATVASAISS